MSLVTPVRRHQPVLVAAVLICAASMPALWWSDALVAISARTQERKP